MQKELNPELFGTGVVGQSRYKEESVMPHRQVMATEEKIAELRTQVKFVMEQMAGLVAQVNEYIKSSQMKLERMQTGLKAMENNHSSTRGETEQRFAHIHHRLSERKIMDGKVQDMMDRHSNVLRTFESRMNHLQTMLAEKDAQVVAAQAALNDAKMEIARLKRF